MKDIFLSYASKDRARATIFVDSLEKEGWTIWWDQTLLGGQDYEKKIKEKLKESRGVIALLSKNSVDSQWVRAECNYAMDQYKKPLLPVLLESVELPIRFYGLNALDLTNWDGSTDYQEFKRLLRSLLGLIGQPLSAPHSEPDKKRESVNQEPSPIIMDPILPDIDPLPTTKGLSRFIFLPFGIPFVVLLLSHFLIKVFG